MLLNGHKVYSGVNDPRRLADIGSGRYSQSAYALPRSSEQRVIVPDEAEFIVSTLNRDNEENFRKATPSHYKVLADVIRNGHWQVTHQGIAFFENGMLADGQNRLYACISAGKPIEVVITYGMTREEAAAIDQQKPRTSEVVAKMLGYQDYGRNVLAVARAMMGASRTRLDNYRLFQWVEDHEEAIRFVMRPGSGMTRHASYTAALAVGWYWVADDVIDRFMDAVSTGNTGSYGAYQTCPPCRLRDWGAGAWGKSLRPKPSEIYARTQKALWLFNQRKECARIQVEAEDVFSLGQWIPGTKRTRFVRSVGDE